MSIYESIKRASIKPKRTMFDFNISIVGKEVKAIRIHQEEDIFQDFSDPSILQTNVITASIRFPDEVPLERSRISSQTSVSSSKTYFYDILPIEIFAKLSDNIERNDFLFFFLEDEKNNKIPHLLQITDVFGKFEIGMVWKKFYASPYNGSDIEKIIPYLEEYVIRQNYDEYKEENPDSSYLMDSDDFEDYYHESFKNIFENPLNPRAQNITFSEDLVIQCAFGSISIEGYPLVTPEDPLKITTETEITLTLGPSLDCKYPSVYKSEYLHPFILDKKNAYYISESFTEDLSGSFTVNLEFMKKDQSSIIVFIDETGEFLYDTFSILGSYDIQKYRPIFYVEDTLGNFVSIVIKENYDIELTGKIGTTNYSHIFGNVEETENIPFSFEYDSGDLNFNVLSDSFTVEDTQVFLEKEYYLGYEPERYINDFIRQVYL